MFLIVKVIVAVVPTGVDLPKSNPNGPPETLMLGYPAGGGAHIGTNGGGAAGGAGGGNGVVGGGAHIGTNGGGGAATAGTDVPDAVSTLPPDTAFEFTVIGITKRPTYIGVKDTETFLESPAAIVPEKPP